MLSCLFVLNPNAGLRAGRRLLPDLLLRLEEADYLPTVFVTRQRGEAIDLVRDLGGTVDLIVACGGDGTLNEVITGLIRGEHKTPLGYIPCGSTNDFASGLGIPIDPLQACDDLLRGDLRPLDVGLFGEDRFFSYTASFGAFTAVSYSTPQNVKNVLGHAAYILEGIRSLADIRPLHARITVDDRTFEQDYIFGAICNSTSLGGVLRLENSAVHMSDGLFESLLIPFPADLLALNGILNALRTHDYAHPSLTFTRASSFLVESDPPIRWTLDGEEAEGARELRIRNLRQAILLKTASRE